MNGNHVVKLVNARHVKNVPGRKSDVLDCRWLQRLHTYALLERAFRPAEQVCALRAYVRQRMNLVRYSASHIQHMQKALAQMNLQMTDVVSDITLYERNGVSNLFMCYEPFGGKWYVSITDHRAKVD